MRGERKVWEAWPLCALEEGRAQLPGVQFSVQSWPRPGTVIRAQALEEVMQSQAIKQ